jgi:hypothetical protein
MKSLLLRQIVYSGLVASFLGCTPTAPKPTAEGEWRKGQVTKIESGRDLKDIWKRECVAPLGAEEIAASKFAVIAYLQGRMTKYRTVKIVDDGRLQNGSLVWIDVGNCAAVLEIISPKPNAPNS